MEKSKVSASVHSFLLVLCTSYRHGVIFKDRLIGLGKQHQNTLMITVLNGLERPWDHSYAKELVIKICAACTDLTRILWSSLKTYLEPRPTKHWLNAVKFSQKLLIELGPSCIEHCINDLSPHQVIYKLINYRISKHYDNFSGSSSYSILSSTYGYFKGPPTRKRNSCANY